MTTNRCAISGKAEEDNKCGKEDHELVCYQWEDRRRTVSLSASVIGLSVGRKTVSSCAISDWTISGEEDSKLVCYQ